MGARYDTVIKNGLHFDGTGAPGVDPPSRDPRWARRGGGRDAARSSRHDVRASSMRGASGCCPGSSTFIRTTTRSSSPRRRSPNRSGTGSRPSRWGAARSARCCPTRRTAPTSSRASSRCRVSTCSRCFAHERRGRRPPRTPTSWSTIRSAPTWCRSSATPTCARTSWASSAPSILRRGRPDRARRDGAGSSARRSIRASSASPR